MRHNDRCLKILDEMSEGIYFVDMERRIVFWNKGAEAITGFNSAEVTGSLCYDNILRHIDEFGVNLCQNGCPLQHTLDKGLPNTADVYLHHKDGHRIPVHVSISPSYDGSGRINGAVEIFFNNSARSALIEEVDRLRSQALFDNLTGLPNRRFLDMTMSTRMGEFSRYGVETGILFVDIDDFKGINDSFSHLAGDKILSIISKTLNGNVRNNDFVGRWGGDEFLIILSRIDIEILQRIANKLITLVSSSSYYDDDGRSIPVSISAGGTVAQPGDTVMSIFSRADKLLYESKQNGKNRVSVR